MNKAELIQKIADESQMPKTKVQAVVDGAIAAVTNALASGENVTIPGFGTFAVKERAARTGISPKTGEKIQISACKGVSFHAGKVLKDSVQ